jgi:hypothetical protein
MEFLKKNSFSNIIVYIILIIISLFIIINFTLIWQNNKNLNLLFDGFYSADPVFCEEANLDMLVIYFDKGDGYIMMKGADGTILLNDVIQYKLVNKSGNVISLSKPILFEIIFKGMEDQIFFPFKQMLEFIPSTQRIKLYNHKEKTIYALLYKNNAISDIKQLLT